MVMGKILLRIFSVISQKLLQSDTRNYTQTVGQGLLSIGVFQVLWNDLLGLTLHRHCRCCRRRRPHH